MCGKDEGTDQNKNDRCVFVTQDISIDIKRLWGFFPLYTHSVTHPENEQKI